jgi:signal transduction histidine kinase
VAVAGVGLGGLVGTGPVRAVILLAVATFTGLAATRGAVLAARAAGEAAGRRAEQARTLRLLHDTVLQTLEAMAMGSELDRTAPAAAVTELRRAAMGQAAALRHAMAQLTGGNGPDLGAELAGLVERFGGQGLRVELVVAERLPEPAPTRRAALCGAACAALGNVVKHAGVTGAVVRVEADRGGLRLVVRDTGVGFDVAGTAQGFGTSQSVHARLREVGGRAVVTSARGFGTRVELWVPR